jgi:hypothetical protein
MKMLLDHVSQDQIPHLRHVLLTTVMQRLSYVKMIKHVSPNYHHVNSRLLIQDLDLMMNAYQEILMLINY